MQNLIPTKGDKMSNAVIINNCGVEFEVANGEAFTTSLNVAEVFDKQHKHILAKIGEFPQDIFNGSNFRLVEYKDKKGESRPYYKISKDGFVLLAMSFTGERFYKFKVAYINAFNAMADEIKRLKFEAYVNKIAELDAANKLKARNHASQINGYKSQISQHNKEIELLKAKAVIERHERDKRIEYIESELTRAGNIFKNAVDNFLEHTYLVITNRQKKGN